jgi:hypothetical protein
LAPLKTLTKNYLKLQFMTHVFARLKTALAVFTFITLLSLSACKKDSTTSNPGNQQDAVALSEENVETNADFDDIGEMGLAASSDVEGIIGGSNASTNGNPSMNGPLGGPFHFGIGSFENLASKTGPCTNITVYPQDSSFPKTITIDYGTTGCVCLDGKTRKGKIVLQYSAAIQKPGAVLSITFSDYYIIGIYV